MLPQSAARLGLGLVQLPMAQVQLPMAQVVRTLSEVTAQEAAPEGLIQLAQMVRSRSEAPVVLGLVTMQRPPATMLGGHRGAWLAQSKQTCCLCGGC